MNKALGWSTAVLGVVLLFSAVSVSAQTERSTGQSQGRLAANIIAVPSALPSGVLTTWGNAISLMDDDRDSKGGRDRDDWNKGDDKDKYVYNGGDGDGDKDDHHRHWYHHDPTPEPSTLLSFGAAILIGGAVLYSRRLRKSK